MRVSEMAPGHPWFGITVQGDGHPGGVREKPSGNKPTPPPGNFDVRTYGEIANAVALKFLRSRYGRQPELILLCSSKWPRVSLARKDPRGRGGGGWAVRGRKDPPDRKTFPS